MEQVSRKIEGGIESAYFDVQYRPSIDHSNFKLNLKCSSLLTYMALADITRKEEQINNLMLKFCEILSKCKTPEDFSNLTTFMNITANVGGYAMEFNSKVNGLINQDGKNRAQQYIKNVEKQKKVNADNLEDFKETYARLNMALVELKESSMKDDEEVAYIIAQISGSIVKGVNFVETINLGSEFESQPNVLYLYNEFGRVSDKRWGLYI